MKKSLITPLFFSCYFSVENPPFDFRLRRINVKKFRQFVKIFCLTYCLKVCIKTAMYFFPKVEIEKEALIRFTIALVISKRKPIYFILLQVKGNFAEV